MSPEKETHEFKTEVQQLLNLIVNSLYSTREIFLRELISNASDAIDKLKYEGLLNKEILEGNESFKINLNFNDEANTITRTLFVGLAMVESTAIYCFVVAMILIFANPFWNQVLELAGG